MNAKTLIFVPLSLAFASAPALSLTLDDISTKLSAIKTVKANFTSERNLKGAPKPLVAKGRMTLIEGKGVVWEQTSPFAEEILVKDDQVEIRRGKSKPEIITKKSQPRAFAFASLMRNLPGADAKTLGNWFTVSSISGTASGWTVTLKPSRDPLRQAFDTVTIKGGDAVTGVSFLSPAKDRTRIRFDDVHVNEGGLADAEERLSR